MNRPRTRRLAAAALIGGATLVALFAATLEAGNAAGTAAPSNQSPPTITGSAEAGKALTATTGRWDGTTPVTFAHSWLRCDADGGSCAAISGADSDVYTLKAVDVGNTLRVAVTAKNGDGSSSTTSVPTAVVRAAPQPPASTSCSANAPLQASGITAPERLSIDRHEMSPRVAGRSTSTLTVRFHVACDGKSVQGALVFVTATPYNQFSIPAEETTGADGWATLTMTRRAGYPATSRQRLLVMFVRARKQGDNILAGISTRRLVSFPVNLSN